MLSPAGHTPNGQVGGGNGVWRRRRRWRMRGWWGGVRFREYVVLEAPANGAGVARGCAVQADAIAYVDARPWLLPSAHPWGEDAWTNPEGEEASGGAGARARPTHALGKPTKGDRRNGGRGEAPFRGSRREAASERRQRARLIPGPGEPTIKGSVRGGSGPRTHGGRTGRQPPDWAGALDGGSPRGWERPAGVGAAKLARALRGPGSQRYAEGMLDSGQGGVRRF